MGVLTGTNAKWPGACQLVDPYGALRITRGMAFVGKFRWYR